MTDERQIPDHALRVLVTYDESENMGTEYHSDEPYDYTWHGDATFEVVKAEATDEKSGYHSEGFLIYPSDEVWVVYGTYSYGDSFGHGFGKGFLIGAFGHEKAARAAKEAVMEQSKEYSLTIIDDFGRKVQVSNPGAGYFESLDTVQVVSLAL